MIQTERLTLVPATVASLRAELDHTDGPEALAGILGVDVPEEWPPELYDRGAIQWVLERIQDGAVGDDWMLHYVVLGRPGDRGLAVGAAGYKGAPTDEGTVEIGYGILEQFQRRGLASEAVRGLIENAFEYAEVERVVAETLPGLTPSIGVLEKLGFSLLGAGSEEGVIRYALERTDYGS